jgi:molybdate transport system ATP-binding protein
MRLRLDGVSLALPEFELNADFEVTTNALGIFGPSGSGKTTLLEVIAGLRDPDRGRVFVDDGELTALKTRERRVGYVPQDETLFPHMTVRGNVMYAMWRRRSRRPALSPPRAAALHEQRINLLEIDSLLDRSVAKLSGGERRRVALARAMMTDPRLLLLDEPLTGLDTKRKDELIAILRELQTPLIFVSHERDDIAALCEHVVTIDRGQCSPPASDPQISLSRASRPQLNR